jgi:hypothetical protein
MIMKKHEKILSNRVYRSRTKCICGSRNIATTIIYISDDENAKNSKHGIIKRCLDCDRILLMPIDWEFYDCRPECRLDSVLE